MRFSRRLDGLPEYLADARRRAASPRRARAGVDVISLGVGDPDMPPPAELADVLGREAAGRDAHGYPTNRGLKELREAVAGYYARRFGVVLDPEREVLPLLGAKEGLAHLCLAQLDAGDAALVADPGYPVYRGGPALAGAEAIALPLRAEHGFLPDLAAIDDAEREAREPADLRLPEQPDRRGRRRRLLAAAGGVRARARTSRSPRQRLRRADLRRVRRAELPRRRPTRSRRASRSYSLSKALNMPGWRDRVRRRQRRR